jgi:hypothetical protein
MGASVIEYDSVQDRLYSCVRANLARHPMIVLIMLLIFRITFDKKENAGIM